MGGWPEWVSPCRSSTPRSDSIVVGVIISTGYRDHITQNVLDLGKWEWFTDTLIALADAETQKCRIAMRFYNNWRDHVPSVVHVEQIPKALHLISFKLY